MVEVWKILGLGQKWAVSEGGWPLFGLFLELLSTLRPDIFTNLPNQPYPLYSGVLKNCCLVSKSWTPRARKHLFADITFRSADDLKSWKETFPNPLASPAYHTYILSVHCVRAVTTADAGPGGWLTGFSSVVYLETWDHEVTPGESMISLVPFHRFSPVLKYLRLTSAFLPPSRVFNFILSFPHLEGLTVTTYQRALTDDNDGSDGSSTIAQPWNPPAFTGYLDLLIMGGMKPIARRLLSLSGGFNFWKLNLTCFHEEDFSLAMALVERCSRTLKSFSITCDLFGTFVLRLHPNP